MRVVWSLFFLLFGWGFLAASEYQNILTPNEKMWVLKRVDPVVVGITAIPNQVIKESNQTYGGYAVDLYHKIAKLTGLTFKFHYYPTWHDVVEAARLKEIDVLFLAQKTPSRLAYLDFTDKVLSLQNKIIVRANRQKKLSLSTASIAVTRGSALEEYLLAHFAKAKVVPVENLLEGLRSVAEGNVDAVVAEPVRAGYFIKKYNLDNLKIADDLGYDYALRIASRSDIPMLNVILSKAVEAIPPDEFEALRLKWGYMRSDMTDRKTLIFMGIILVLIALFSGYLFKINRRLQREIGAKERALEELNRLLKEQKRLEENLQKRVEEEVEKNRQQEIFMFQQNRLAQLGELLGMITHQWQQPLNNLFLAHQLLYSRYRQGKLDEEMMTRFKKTVKENIEHMSATIEDFKNFYKIENKKQVFDVSQTVISTVEMVRPAFEKEAIEFVLQITPGCRAFGYKNGLSQVVLNLVNNAKEAYGRQLTPTKRIKVEVSCEKRKTVIAVEDNAGGVPDAIEEKIFTPYFSTKGKKGSGLGLYMTKKIVEEQLNGSIVLRNTKMGARFVIELGGKERG